MSATAQYKTTNTTHTTTADGTGHADLPFDISRATYGYTVAVDIHVTVRSGSASCSTSFTPSA